MKKQYFDIDQFVEAKQISVNTENNPFFYAKVLNKIEDRKRQENTISYRIGHNYKTIGISVMVAANIITAVVMFSSWHYENTTLRNENLTTIAQTYAIDQTEYNLLTINK